MKQECPSQQELVEFESGGLAPARRELMEQHLSSCTDCNAKLVLEDQSFLAKLGLGNDSRIEADCPELSGLINQLIQPDTSPTLENDTVREREPTTDPVLTAFLEPATSDDELGRLGSYSVQRVLGRGGMGIVFEALDLNLNRAVAIKAMKQTSAECINQESRKRFHREAQTMAAIRHDNIVRVHQVGESNGIPFIASELLEGETLADRLKREERLPAKEALRIASEILNGLHAANERGVVHRDIKPSNIFLESKLGRVKILDFGLAARLEETGDLTMPGTILGTPNYLSPEQATGHSADVRSDLFSVGIVLYEMLTGVQPFERKNLIATLNAIATEQPNPPNELFADVDSRVAGLVMRLLTKDPGMRWETADQVREAILSLLDLLENEQIGIATISKIRSAKRMFSIRMAWWLGLGFAGCLIVFSGYIIYIKTRFGTLKIEVTDPEIVVSVNGTDILIEGAGSRRISLKPGKQTIHVKRGDIEFNTREFQVRRGKRVVINVSYVDGRLNVVGNGELIDSRKAGAINDSRRIGITWLEYGYVNVNAIFDPTRPLTMEWTLHAAKPQKEKSNIQWLGRDGVPVIQLLRMPDDRIELQTSCIERELTVKQTERPVDFSKDQRIVVVYEPRKSISLFLNEKLEIELKCPAVSPIKETLHCVFSMIGYEGMTIDDVLLTNAAKHPSDQSDRDELREKVQLDLPFQAGKGNVFRDHSVFQNLVYPKGRFTWSVKKEGRWVAIDDPAPVGDFALNFSGARTVQVASFMDVKQPVTIECQFKSPNPPAEESVVFQYRVKDGGIGLLRTGDSRLAIQTWAAGRLFRRETDEAVDFSEWRHLAMVYSVDRIRLFVDGKSVVTLDGIPELSEYQSSKRRGLSLAGSRVGQIEGGYDELRLSKIVRYGENFHSIKRFKPDVNTVCLFHFDEGRYNVAFDACSNVPAVRIADENAWFKVNQE